MSERSPAEFGLQLKRAQHVVGLQVNECLQPFNLNLGLWRVLREVAERPGASASELARASMHSSQTLGSSLERLRSAGLIERTEPRGRVVSNYVTKEGERLLKQANAAVETVMSTVLRVYSPSERATLEKLIERLVTSSDAG